MGLVLSGSPMKSVVIDYLQIGLKQCKRPYLIIWYDTTRPLLMRPASNAAALEVSPDEMDVKQFVSYLGEEIEAEGRSLGVEHFEWVIVYTNLSREQIKPIEAALQLVEHLFSQSIVTCK